MAATEQISDGRIMNALRLITECGERGYTLHPDMLDQPALERLIGAGLIDVVKAGQVRVMAISKRGSALLGRVHGCP